MRINDMEKYDKEFKDKEILALPYYYIMRIIFINNLTVKNSSFQILLVIYND